MQIGVKEFDFSRRSYVMGILNVTPDSFSDGGEFITPEAALDHALQMEAEGATIIDIGAESTRPGSRPINAEEEGRRLFPLLQRLIPRLKIPISIDTRRAAIAERALREGAQLINDVSALRFDFRMAEVIAEADAPCILMHMRGDPASMQQDVRYLNVISEIIHFLKVQIQIAVKMGISRSNLLVDPGFGFGKELSHNLEILRGLSEFKVLECPIVVGLSRKTMIRRIVGEEVRGPSVIQGSVTAAAIAALKGAALVRVHDVAPTVKALRVVQALQYPLEFSNP